EIASRLLRDRRDEGRVRVAEARDRDASDEVEILATIDGEEGGPASVGESRRRALVVAEEHAVGLGRDGRRVEELRRFRHAGDASESGTDWSKTVGIIVPVPERVKSSRSSECGTSAPTMCADGTPWSTASSAAETFGIIPRVRAPGVRENLAP